MNGLVFILDLLATPAFLLIGAVIFWRMANTWMGLFASFLLINFGSLGLSTLHFNALQVVLSFNVPVLLSIIMFPQLLLAYPCLA